MRSLTRTALCALLLALLAACGGTPAAPSPTAPAATAMPADMDMASPAAPTDQPVPAALKIVASTSWVAAFAKAAGATDVTVIAPSNLQHPPDYDPKPADLAAVSGADYVLLAGFEGFAARLQEAVGGDSAKLITVMTENSPAAIHTEVTRLGELFGTQQQAAAWLATFDTEYAALSGEVKASLGDSTPVVVAQAFAVPWVIFAGLEPAGTYGPMPLTPDELKQLADLKPAVVFENVHMGGGAPVVEATGAKQIDLLNFPGDDLDLLAVFRTNAERIKAALGGGAEAAGAYPVTIENCGNTLTFTQAPERVATLYPPTTELMLQLGLAQRIVGAGAVNDAAPLPELAAAYEALPVLTKTGGPAKEVLINAKPDLVFDNQPDYFYDATQGFATQDDLKAAGAQIYTMTAKCGGGKLNATIDDIYTDLRNLGTIFGVSDKAEATIAQMQQRIAAVQAKVTGLKPVTVMYYDAGEGPLNVFGPGTWEYVLNLAGGANVFSDLKESYAQVSAEQVAARDADVFIVAGYTGDGVKTPEERVTYLKQTFANASAVKNNRVVIIPYEHTNPGLQNVLGVEEIARALHPDAFAESGAEGEFDGAAVQELIDTAGFHEMAEAIASTQKLDPASLATVQRVAEGLRDVRWPAALKEPAEAFLASLRDLEQALESGDVAAATAASDAVHDTQHELSHAIEGMGGSHDH